MAKLTQEQYKALQARGWNDTKIESVARSQGYDMPDDRDLLEKASGVGEKILGFTGGQNIAEVGGTLAKGAFQTGSGMDLLTPEAKARITPQQAQAIQEPMESTGVLKAVGQQGVGRVAGDVGQIGLNVGIAAVPPAGSLKVALGTGAALSGGIAGAKGISEGKTATEALKGAVVPTIFGATFFGAGYGLGKLAGVLTKKSPEALYQSALKQSKPDLMKEITHKAPELSKQLIERGVRGNDNKIYTTAIKGLMESEKGINKIASGSVGAGKIQTANVVTSLDEISRRSRNVFGNEGAVAVDNVKQAILAKGQTITVKDALLLKRDIYKELSRSAFNVDASLSNQSESLRAIAGSLADEIAKASPDIAALTKSQQMWIRTAHAIEGKAGMARNNIIGLSDSILGAGAVATGDVLSLIPLVGRRVLETARVKTNTAVLLDRIGKIPTDSLGKISKSAVMNLLKGLRD